MAWPYSIPSRFTGAQDAVVGSDGEWTDVRHRYVKCVSIKNLKTPRVYMLSMRYGDGSTIAIRARKGTRKGQQKSVFEGGINAAIAVWL